MSLFVNSDISARGLAILFGIKLLFGIATVWIYTYYYTDRAYADIYKYFDDGNVIFENIAKYPTAALKVITGIGYNHNDPAQFSVIANTQHFDKGGGGYLESNNHLIIRVNTFLRFFSLGSIYIHTLFFCYLSFVGMVALYRAMQQFFEGKNGRVLVVPIFLLPSVLFWSSGVFKETLVLFFVGTLFFSAIKVLDLKNIFTNLLIATLCLNALYHQKPFIALSFLAGFYAMATLYFRGYIRIIAVLSASMFGLWFLYMHHTMVCELMSSIIAKRNDFVALGLKMKAGSLIDSSIKPTTCLEPIRLLPQALYNMFFQPFVWSTGLFEKVFGFENLLILIATGYCLVRMKRPTRAKLQLAVFCLVFFLLNYIVIGWTVPIAGALVRYKIFGLLFYVILLLSILNLNKFISDIKTTFLVKLYSQKIKLVIFK